MKKLFVAAIVLMTVGMGAEAQVYFSADFSAAQGYANAVDWATGRRGRSMDESQPETYPLTILLLKTASSLFAT
jgi:hypothetical protein